MKRCPYCGAEYPDDAVECQIDHTPLVAKLPEPAAGPPPAPSEGRIGLAIGALVIGILSVVLSIFLVGGLLAIVAIVLSWIYLAKRQRPAGMARWGIVLAVLGLIASVGFGAFYVSAYKQIKKAMASAASDGEDDPTKWEGVKAPDLTMTTLEGKELKLSDFRGKRVVLDFWSTWCPPCRQEIPHFVKLYNETSRDKLIVIGVSDEPASTLKKFARDNGITYPVGNGKELAAPYKNISAIPATFFIDSKGTIQKIEVGYHDYASIRSQALGEDFKGEVKDGPSLPASLADAEVQFKTARLWSTNLWGAQALCAGAWRGDGQAQVLVAAGSTLHVLDLAGRELTLVKLPGEFQFIECGRHRAQGARLLGYDNWGHAVTVVDARGTKLWDVGGGAGVDGAHWGDLDGDGTDELIVGRNGGGGLQAWSSDGKQMWSAKLGNVWNQAVVPARPGQPALVVATEALGSVKVFDAAGTLTRTLRPNGGYYARMAACRGAQGIQIAAINRNETTAFDENGKVAWTTSAVSDHGGWWKSTFALGDLDGDGAPDWVFVDGSGDLVIANMKGEKISAIPGANKFESFVVAPRKGKGGVLVTLSGQTLMAYEFVR